MKQFPQPKKTPLLRKKSESWLMKLLSYVLFFAPDFMKHMWTTISVPFSHARIYVPTKYDSDTDWGTKDWIYRHMDIIGHESIHVWRAEQWSAPLLALAYIGPAPFVVVASAVATIWWPAAQWGILVGVLLLPLSVGLAYGRWFIEREAYMLQIAVSDNRAADIKWIVNTLWTQYLAPWPKEWMTSWFEKESKKLDG